MKSCGSLTSPLPSCTRAPLSDVTAMVASLAEGGKHAIHSRRAGEGCEGQSFTDLAGEAVELRPAAVSRVLLGVEKANPQARRPGVLNLLPGPLPPASRW